MSENTNQKDVLIKVTVDNQDAQSATEALKKKFKALSEQALKFDEIDFDNASIGDLRDHLQQANQVLQDLKDSGMASEQQLADMDKTVKKLKSTISGAKFSNMFNGLEATIKGVVGSAQLLQGSMAAFGLESEEANEQIARLMSLMSIVDGIKNLREGIETMKGLAGATKSTTGAVNGLKIGFQSLGIGLLVTALTYLINNWDSVYSSIKSVIPEVEGVGKWFSKIMPVIEGVGKAVIGFVVTPIKAAIDAFKALRNLDFAGAGKALADAFNPLNVANNALNNFKSGMNDAIMKKDVADKIKKSNEQLEREIKLLEASGASTEKIYNLKKKMMTNEINLLQSKNKHMSAEDKKRVKELQENLQLESATFGKFLSGEAEKAKAERQKAIDAAKAQYQQLLEEVKGYVLAANKVIADSGRTERERELNDIAENYAEQIAKAKKAGQDTTKLVEAQKIEQAAINKKYDDEILATVKEADKLISDSKKLARQVETDDVTLHYDELIKKAKENNIEFASLEEAKQLKLQEIKQKYDTEALKDSNQTRLLNVETQITSSESGSLDKNGDIKLSADAMIANAQALHEAKMAQLTSEYEAERELYKDNKDKLALIDAQYANNVVNLEAETKDKKIAIAKAEKDEKEALQEANLNSAANAADALGQLAEGHTIFAKSMGVASATIDTFVGANKALAQGGFIGIATATAVIATGLANIKKIVSTKVSKKDSVRAGSTAPTINMAQLAPRQTQDVRVVEQTATATPKQEPIKAYITNRDLETNQDKKAFNDSYRSI